MLGHVDAVATIAVKDEEKARKFYGETLGLESIPNEYVLMFQSGSSKIMVYRSEFAGTNKATAVTWTVADVEAEASALRSRGVTFEHYDFPGGTREGDIHIYGKVKNAWFKDPDGNILSIVSG